MQPKYALHCRWRARGGAGIAASLSSLRPLGPPCLSELGCPVTNLLRPRPAAARPKILTPSLPLAFTLLESDSLVLFWMPRSRHWPSVREMTVGLRASFGVCVGPQWQAGQPTHIPLELSSIYYRGRLPLGPLSTRSCRTPLVLAKRMDKDDASKSSFQQEWPGKNVAVHGQWAAGSSDIFFYKKKDTNRKINKIK